MVIKAFPAQRGLYAWEDPGNAAAPLIEDGLLGVRTVPRGGLALADQRDQEARADALADELAQERADHAALRRELAMQDQRIRFLLARCNRQQRTIRALQNKQWEAVVGVALIALALLGWVAMRPL